MYRSTMEMTRVIVIYVNQIMCRLSNGWLIQFIEVLIVSLCDGTFRFPTSMVLRPRSFTSEMWLLDGMSNFVDEALVVSGLLTWTLVFRMKFLQCGCRGSGPEPEYVALH